MYITFTEEQAEAVRKLGLSVIEYKRHIKQETDMLLLAVGKFSDKVITSFKVVVNAVSEAFDNLRFAFEELRNSFNYETSTRYKVVKFLSKCGFNKYDMWKRTRYIRLARSNC